MFARKSMSGWYLIGVLMLIALLLALIGVSPAAAKAGASPVYAETTISVAEFDATCVSPNPVIPQSIRLSGDFVIQAHIVLPPNPVLPPSPILPPSPVFPPAGAIVTLHLDATRISGVGLEDGTLYQGSQGTSQHFVFESSSMDFVTTFNLFPAQAAEVPPSPVCPVQLAFQVEVVETEPGFAVITAILDSPE